MFKLTATQTKTGNEFTKIYSTMSAALKAETKFERLGCENVRITEIDANGDEAFCNGFTADMTPSEKKAHTKRLHRLATSRLR